MGKSRENMRAEVGVGTTIGFGSVLAIVLSWTANHAIGWAVIHGFLGWIYVVYYLFTKSGWTWF